MRSSPSLPANKFPSICAKYNETGVSTSPLHLRGPINKVSRDERAGKRGQEEQVIIVLPRGYSRKLWACHLLDPQILYRLLPGGEMWGCGGGAWQGVVVF